MGKTGHGKSATGNTILGTNKFRSSDMGDSATLETDVGWAERSGQMIKVVDGPGLLDTRMAGVKQLAQMQENLSKGFRHCPNGFHALVLVLRYGQRYTDEEKKTVAFLKGMLGNDVIQNHCILLFTHGENFLMANPNGNFQEWCSNQKGDLRQLLDECNNRVVLFHNLTPEKREESTNQLISLARGLGQRYTAELFDKIRGQRMDFIQEHGAIQLKALIEPKINLIIDCLERGDTGERLTELVNKLETEINKEIPHLEVVVDVKQGIEQTREGKYSEALETFKKIEYNGKRLLLSLQDLILIIMAQFLESLLHLVE